MKKTYLILSPVEHDDVRYEIGASVLLSDADAAGLLAVSAVALDASGPAVADAPVVPMDAGERQTAIIAAIGQLDPANNDLWLKDGKPSSDAIAAITGWPLSATERNSAWASMQPAA